MASNYGIKNKATGLFFGGFDEAYNVLWVGRESATAYPDPRDAECQALLLRRFGIPAQRKPVLV